MTALLPPSISPIRHILSYHLSKVNSPICGSFYLTMSPSKLPNEIADASSTMQAPDAVKKVGSSDLSNSPIDTPLLTSKLDPSASPFRSFHDSQNSNPFFESTYPSQKLRMRVREEDVPNDPYSSPPPTFLPPESTESIEDKDSSAGLSGGSRVRKPIH